MMDFTRPAALLLLPLALLPLVVPRRGTVVFSWLAWLPRDRIGDFLGWAGRAIAVAAMLAIVLALAGPGRAGTQVMRTGHGAEIVVLFDRSRSMDERMLPADWRQVDPLSLRYQAQSRGEPKGQLARELLSKFVAGRPDDRFALIFFSTQPIPVVPFTQHDEVVQAAITAGGVGRGLADTDVGRALAAAIGEFDQRAYTGSRIVLLVSDGGARLDAATRRALLAAARRNRVSLDWIYLRSVNSPRLDTPGDPGEAVPEIALHRFFQTLPGAYHVYEAEDPDGLARAVADVARRQNFPLDYLETVPRRDDTRVALGVALACVALMLALRAFTLEAWGAGGGEERA
jgi:mxaC protein